MKRKLRRNEQQQLWDNRKSVDQQFMFTERFDTIRFRWFSGENLYTFPLFQEQWRGLPIFYIQTIRLLLFNRCHALFDVRVSLINIIISFQLYLWCLNCHRSTHNEPAYKSKLSPIVTGYPLLAFTSNMCVNAIRQSCRIMIHLPEKPSQNGRHHFRAKPSQFFCKFTTFRRQQRMN